MPIHADARAVLLRAAGGVFEGELNSGAAYRASIFYGRGGFTQAALSGIDIALWDAQGRLLGQPVSHLLGGTARDRLRVCYTGNDPSALAEFGIKDMKMAVPYGPAHGEAGMRANEDAIARARDMLGPDGFLALDIYMAWDVDCTLRMYERLAKSNIAWLEEPVMPDDYRGYSEIRRRLNTMVSGGEHEYTLEGFRRLIGEGCVDLVQPDIHRAGGPTGLRKIAALAKAAGIKLICHGTGSATYHFLSSLGPEMTPYAEFLDIYRGEAKTWVLTDDPRPINGELEISTSPGFGYDLNHAAFAPGAGGVAIICSGRKAGATDSRRGRLRPGTIDKSSGRVVGAESIGWFGVEAGKRLRARLNWPIFFANDAILAALAEQWFGGSEAEALRYFVYVRAQGGLGMGVVVDGRILPSVASAAAEFGHVMLYPDGRPCNCGNRGCWEQYASRSGDDRTLSALRATAGSLTLGLVNLVAALNPQAIIMGEPFASAWDLVEDIVQAELRRRVPAYLRGAAALVLAHFFTRFDHIMEAHQ